jgi:hypothetical protein
VRVEREINEEYHTDGEIGHLQEHLTHYPFNKGISYWFERHNRYSTMEVEALVQEVSASFCVSELFSRDPVVRRKALKQLAYRLPGRPFIVFAYLYFARLGFLDGRAGLTYCQYALGLRVYDRPEGEGTAAPGTRERNVGAERQEQNVEC